jgi:ligand-binding sensor domain-containing protein
LTQPAKPLFFRLIFFVLLLFSVQCAFAQAYIGQRKTVNYQKSTYNAGTQNWKIRQDAQGRMYFANNEGVLVFDGAYWQLYPLPNKTIVRSLEFGRDKNLYVGGQDEIGYFSPAKNGLLIFTSIKHLIPKADQAFSDIWDIACQGNDVFFRTHDKIFRYSNNKVTVYSASSWLFLGNYAGKILAHDEQRGLLEFAGDNWKPFLSNTDLPKGFYITSISKFNDSSSLLTSARHGLFLLSGNKLSPFKLHGAGIDNNQHFSACIRLLDGTYLIGTYENGIYQFDKSGNIMENIGKKEGLQNTNIRSLFTDARHNTWLGLDNGIDYIAYNSAVKHIDPAIFKDGAGYSTALYHDNLYFALPNGIYKLATNRSGDLSQLRNDIKIIGQGQTWNLNEVDGRLLAGKDDGIFQVFPDKLLPILNNTGYWTFQSLKNTKGKPLIAAGNYFGVRLFENTGTALADQGTVGKYFESARFMQVDQNRIIWTSHPYRGVYKIDPGTGQVKAYGKEQGLPSTLNNFVYKIKGRIVIATEKGIYGYNPKMDQFEPAKEFQTIFGERALRYLKEDSNGNIWFVQGKSVGVADYSAGPKIINIPELNNRILSGFENIYPVNASNIFIGSENGFYHVNYARYKQNIQPLHVYIRKVSATAGGDSLLFGGYINNVYDNRKQNEAHTPALPYTANGLHFEYSAPIFDDQSNAEYSYRLEGFDKDWSAWTKKPENDYTNLPFGKYTFQVKARNHLDNESVIASYTFVINPPWYRTFWAYLLYTSLILGLLYSVYKFQEKRLLLKQKQKLLDQQKRNEEEQRQTAYLHQLELERAEKEVVQLKNDKLQAEIEFKSSEVASAALNLVQKKEFILKVKDELQQLQKLGKDMVPAADIKRILRLLAEENKVNEEWEQFSIHFDKVHANFLSIIKERYPSINQQELKLCAYLVMNLSSNIGARSRNKPLQAA